MDISKLDLKYNDYVKGVKELNPEEQLNLIEIISAQLKKNIAKKKSKHSIMELEGLGSKFWKGIDAQEYVRKERESWA
ncbi:MAG: hypothetical protein HY786_00250 [Deltaproteobacteria bacterium]|nr:hypothetical protein [Deltaproteobacteria bacterium]